ncbi:sugar ABC transporter substrate-binding protein [Jatrophihabitans sp. YIM 134969]
MRFRYLTPAVASVLLVGTLAACSSSGGSTGGDTSGVAATVAGGSGGVPSAKLRIDYASPVAAQPGQQQFDQGAKAAASVSGSTFDSLDSAVSASKQITNIMTMLQRNPDVIGTWTLDPGATAGVYNQVVTQGIPLIGVNSNDNGITNAVWGSTQLCTADGPWAQTAKMFAKKDPGGKVATIGLDGVPSIDANTKCFTDAAKVAGLDVVAHVSNTSDDSAGGQKLIADVLTKNPDLSGVWAYNDASALGASAAVLAAGKKVSDGTSDGLIITGSNGDSDAVDAIKQGRLTATWDPNNVEMGWLFVLMAQEVKAGSAPKSAVMPATLVDASNAADWVAPGDRTVDFDSLKYTKSDSLDG